MEKELFIELTFGGNLIPYNSKAKQKLVKGNRYRVFEKCVHKYATWYRYRTIITA